MELSGYFLPSKWSDHSIPAGMEWSFHSLFLQEWSGHSIPAGMEWTHPIPAGME